MALNMFTWLPSCFFFLVILGVETWAQSSSLTTGSGTTDSKLPTTTPAIVSTTSEEITTPAIPPTSLPKETDIGPCPCDLTVNSCDVNCCCDPECTADDRTTFSRCITFNSIVDDRLCFQEDIFYAINSKLKSNKTSNGIFCIFYDNYPSRNFYKNPDLITNEKVFEEYARTNPRTTFQHPPQKRTEFAEFYKSGDPVQIIYRNDTLDFLSLPRALNSEYCADLNPASYLSDQTFQCVRNIQDLPAECEVTPSLKVATYFENFRFISSPGIFQDLNITSENITIDLLMELYSSNLTLPFTTITLCKGLQCRQFNNDSNAKIPSPIYNLTEEICYDVTEKVFYEIKYNGTAGITSVNIELHLTDLSSPRVRMMQTFSTVFKQNETDGIPLRKSGNPGYIKSEPIMAGTVEQLVIDLKTTKVVKMSQDRNNWLTLPMSTANGDCSSTTRVPVKFGEEIHTGCLIRATADDLRTLCKQLQNRTNNILLGNSVNTHVASFGNTSVMAVGDWVPILGVNNKPDLLPFHDGYCSLDLGLQIQVIYAQVGSLNNPQSKILGVAYEFEQRRNIYPQCLGLHCDRNSIHILELVATVAYQEVSEPVVQIIAEPPLYQLGLPFDFFYPFASNKASEQLSSPNVTKCLAVSLMLLFLSAIF